MSSVVAQMSGAVLTRELFIPMEALTFVVLYSVRVNGICLKQLDAAFDGSHESIARKALGVSDSGWYLYGHT